MELGCSVSVVRVFLINVFSRQEKKHLPPYLSDWWLERLHFRHSCHLVVKVAL